jgi:hypothetical protein
MTDWQKFMAQLRRPDVQAAMERQSEPQPEVQEHMPVNATIDDMEWEAEMVGGYDGWDDDEEEGI